MTRVELSEAPGSLSEYTRSARNGPVVVTRGGKPVAVLRSLTGEEREDFVGGADIRFAAMIERFRARHKEGTVPLAEAMRKYGVKPNTARRRQAR